MWSTHIADTEEEHETPSSSSSSSSAMPRIQSPPVVGRRRAPTISLHNLFSLESSSPSAAPANESPTHSFSDFSVDSPLTTTASHPTLTSNNNYYTHSNASTSGESENEAGAGGTFAFTITNMDGISQTSSPQSSYNNTPNSTTDNSPVYPRSERSPSYPLSDHGNSPAYPRSDHGSSPAYPRNGSGANYANSPVYPRSSESSPVYPRNNSGPYQIPSYTSLRNSKSQTSLPSYNSAPAAPSNLRHSQSSLPTSLSSTPPSSFTPPISFTPPGFTTPLATTPPNLPPSNLRISQTNYSVPNYTALTSQPPSSPTTTPLYVPPTSPFNKFSSIPNPDSATPPSSSIYQAVKFKPAYPQNSAKTTNAASMWRRQIENEAEPNPYSPIYRLVPLSDTCHFGQQLHLGQQVVDWQGQWGRF